MIGEHSGVLKKISKSTIFCGHKWSDRYHGIILLWTSLRIAKYEGMDLVWKLYFLFLLLLLLLYYYNYFSFLYNPNNMSLGWWFQTSDILVESNWHLSRKVSCSVVDLKWLHKQLLEYNIQSAGYCFEALTHHAIFKSIGNQKKIIRGWKQGALQKTTTWATVMVSVLFQYLVGLYYVILKASSYQCLFG